MKWTYEWLLDYLETNASADDIADKLTEIGLEIEELSRPMVPVVAKIVECSDIPETHLHLLKVDDGTEVRQVVCGAPNCRVGLVSALARPGTIIQGIEIKVGKIKGFESNGMMCSEKELGLGDNHDGIIELKETKLGQPWKDSNDIIMDGSITANRPDYLAVMGIARDLSGAGMGKFKEESAEKIAPVSGKRKAVIKNRERCPVYNFAEIANIKMAPSAAKISSRLAAIGINPKNAAIDATNYIGFDLGQPMHCFDADEIEGDIVIRLAKDGEKFTDLFDAEHTLNADDLVIADAKGILALAGIVGGKRGMTADRTLNIILESAYFEPIGIRKTRRRLNISTDASFRYERGIDPLITTRALAKAVDIITKECGGKIIGLTDEAPAFENQVIKYDPALFLKRTGIDVPEKLQKEILEKLGYAVKADWSVTQPSWRVDDAIPEKLVSDIMRIYGYGHIVDTGVSPSKQVADIKPVKTENEFFAYNRGLTEHISYGFGNLANEKLVSEKKNVEISNPMNDSLNTARNNLLPNMLDAVAENAKKGFSDLAMFELGIVFDGPNPGDEHKQLVIVRTGNAAPRHWLKRERLVDVFDVKADLVAYLGDAKTETENPPLWAHPYRYGRLVRDGKTLGEFGELHPRLARHWKIKVPVMVGLIDNIGPAAKPGATYDDNNFQPITRDFSFVLTREIPAEVIVDAARSADPMISNVREFDFYENSLAFEITISPDRNLSESDLLEIQNKVIAAVESLGAKIRDK